MELYSLLEGDAVVGETVTVKRHGKHLLGLRFSQSIND